MIPLFPWTDEQINILRMLTAEGKTAAEIAAIFGITRGAVCGKWNRLHIKPPPKLRPEKAAAPRLAPKLSPKKAQAPAPIAKPITLPANLGSTPMSPALFSADPGALDHPILALADYDACRFPTGDPRAADFRYCCAPKAGPSPYCREHHALAFISRADRKTAVRKMDEAAWS